MKLQKIEPTSQGHERFVFHIGRAELTLIHAFVTHALQNCPPHPTTTQFRDRCKTIQCGIKKAMAVSLAMPDGTKSTKVKP